MNYFTKKRLAIWAIVILLIVNISAIGTIIMHRYFLDPDYYHCRPNNAMMDKRMNGHKQHKKQRFMQRIFMDIDFSPEQRKQIQQYRKHCYNQSNPILNSMDSLRESILNEIRKDNPDSLLLINISDEIGSLHAKLKKNTINHLLHLKSTCNDEQIEELNFMMKDMIKNSPRHRHRNKHLCKPRECNSVN